MKTLIICLLAVLVCSHVAHAQYSKSYKQVPAGLQKSGGIMHSPAKTGASRGSIKATLERNIQPGFPSKSLGGSPVYFAQESPVSDEELKFLCSQMKEYRNDPHDVTFEQFADFVRSFGYAYKNEKIKKMYDQINFGKPSKFDFMRYCDRHFGHIVSTQRRQLDNFFKTLDKDGTGLVERSEARAEMVKRNVFAEKYLDWALGEADRKKEGKIDYELFLEVSGIL